MIEHRAIDLNLPEHIAAWNTRATDPNARVVTVDQLGRLELRLRYAGFARSADEIRAIIGEVK